MTKPKAAPAVDAVVEVEPVAAPEAEAPVVTATFGDLVIESNNAPVLIDNTDVVEHTQLEPNVDDEIVTEINGFKVIEYK
jgi:hypothetical protein